MINFLQNNCNVSMSFLCLLLLIPQFVSAEGITRQQADDILLELKQIRQLLEKQNTAPTKAAPPPTDQGPARETKLNLKDKIILGDKNAPVIMVEFTDYQCPFCRKFHTEVFQQLKKDHIDTGKVAFISQDLPLGFHNNAMHAAQAARCAGDQNKYWELRDSMIMNASKLSRDDISGYAEDLKLDVSKLNKCIDANTYQKEIDKDVAEAGTAGISGTPTFVFAPNTGEEVTGQIHVGVKSLNFFENIIADMSMPDKEQAITKNEDKKNTPKSKNYRLDTDNNELILIKSGS